MFLDKHIRRNYKNTTWVICTKPCNHSIYNNANYPRYYLTPTGAVVSYHDYIDVLSNTEKNLNFSTREKARIAVRYWKKSQKGR